MFRSSLFPFRKRGNERGKRGRSLTLASFPGSPIEVVIRLSSLAEPDSHTKNGRESGDTRILSWCCTVSMDIIDSFTSLAARIQD